MLNLLPKLGSGGHATILHTILRLLYYSGDPKGGHGPMPPPLNTGTPLAIAPDWKECPARAKLSVIISNPRSFPRSLK